MRRSGSGIVGAISIALIIVLAVVILGLCTVKVPAGYVAVQYNMNGGVKEEVLTQGWHLVTPTTHTVNYTIGIEQSYLTKGNKGDSRDDESYTASSREGKPVDIDLTFTYQYKANEVTKVYNQFKGQSGKDVRDSFIKPNIVSWSKEVIARYKVAEMLGAERASINVALTDYLADRFAPYGITISNVSLIDIRVDKETEEAIGAKIKAQQEAETQAINNQMAIDKANAEAEVKRTQAQATADAQLISANAEAEAMLVKANAEAEANKLINESLSDALLRRDTIEAWRNGANVPSVIMGNGGTNALFDIGSLIK